MSRQHRTPLALGFFIGCCVIMCNWFLVIAVDTGAQVNDAAALPCVINTSALNASCVFSVFLFVAYGLFTYFLVQSRSEILGDGPWTVFLFSSFFFFFFGAYVRCCQLLFDCFLITNALSLFFHTDSAGDGTTYDLPAPTV